MYYRLSKSEHARIKAARKQKAIDQATDLYGRAKSSLASGDMKTAFDLDLRAFDRHEGVLGRERSGHAGRQTLALGEPVVQ